LAQEMEARESAFKRRTQPILTQLERWGPQLGLNVDSLEHEEENLDLNLDLDLDPHDGASRAKVRGAHEKKGGKSILSSTTTSSSTTTPWGQAFQNWRADMDDSLHEWWAERGAAMEAMRGEMDQLRGALAQAQDTLATKLAADDLPPATPTPPGTLASLRRELESLREEVGGVREETERQLSEALVRQQERLDEMEKKMKEAEKQHQDLHETSEAARSTWRDELVTSQSEWREQLVTAQSTGWGRTRRLAVRVAGRGRRPGGASGRKSRVGRRGGGA
jgi:DNA repair exonuclease SbcCD ATPase subunit